MRERSRSHPEALQTGEGVFGIIRADGAIAVKFRWWGRQGATDALGITGRRLDQSAKSAGVQGCACLGAEVVIDAGNRSEYSIATSASWIRATEWEGSGAAIVRVPCATPCRPGLVESSSETSIIHSLKGCS